VLPALITIAKKLLVTSLDMSDLIRVSIHDNTVTITVIPSWPTYNTTIKIVGRATSKTTETVFVDVVAKTLLDTFDKTNHSSTPLRMTVVHETSIVCADANNDDVIMFRGDHHRVPQHLTNVAHVTAITNDDHTLFTTSLLATDLLQIMTNSCVGSATSTVTFDPVASTLTFDTGAGTDARVVATKHLVGLPSASTEEKKSSDNPMGTIINKLCKSLVPLLTHKRHTLVTFGITGNHHIVLDVVLTKTVRVRVECF
jgi:hypothetical protein